MAAFNSRALFLKLLEMELLQPRVPRTGRPTFLRNRGSEAQVRSQSKMAFRPLRTADELPSLSNSGSRMHQGIVCIVVDGSESNSQNLNALDSTPIARDERRLDRFPRLF